LRRPRDHSTDIAVRDSTPGVDRFYDMYPPVTSRETRGNFGGQLLAVDDADDGRSAARHGGPENTKIDEARLDRRDVWT
jgi:hypothetical protein